MTPTLADAASPGLPYPYAAAIGGAMALAIVVLYRQTVVLNRREGRRADGYVQLLRDVRDVLKLFAGSTK